MRHIYWFVLVLAVALFPACGKKSDNLDGSDVDTDVDGDTDSDTDGDTDTDVDTDTAVDTGTGAPGDTATPGDSETSSDTGTETETASDTGTDTMTFDWPSTGDGSECGGYSQTFPEFLGTQVPGDTAGDAEGYSGLTCIGWQLDTDGTLHLRDYNRFSDCVGTSFQGAQVVDNSIYLHLRENGPVDCNCCLDYSYDIEGIASGEEVSLYRVESPGPFGQYPGLSTQTSHWLTFTPVVGQSDFKCHYVADLYGDTWFCYDNGLHSACHEWSCAEGYECVGDRCRTTCTGDTDCPEPITSCITGHCYLPGTMVDTDTDTWEIDTECTPQTGLTPLDVEYRFLLNDVNLQSGIGQYCVNTGCTGMPQQVVIPDLATWQSTTNVIASPGVDWSTHGLVIGMNWESGGGHCWRAEPRFYENGAQQTELHFHFWVPNKPNMDTDFSAPVKWGLAVPLAHLPDTTVSHVDVMPCPYQGDGFNTYGWCN